MNRIGLIVCAIRGHTWTDYSINYQPEYGQRFTRCRRCQTWTMHERDRTPQILAALKLEGVTDEEWAAMDAPVLGACPECGQSRSHVVFGSTGTGPGHWWPRLANSEEK